MQHWALCANPRKYNVERAVRDLEVDWWTTKGRPVSRGDRVIVWKAKGAHDLRGIVALGDVLSEPEYRTESDNPYWVHVVAGITREPRVTIRYVVPTGLPIWYGEATRALLNRLSVCRARGGTVFYVTARDWQHVLRAAGGLPERAQGRP